MDDLDQAKAYAEADFSEPNALFIDAFKTCFQGADVAGYVVDLGCGPADITVRFALAYLICRVHGIDGSAAMLRFGKARVLQAGLSERVGLFQCLIPDGALPQPRYDALICNSLLHHLADPHALWNIIQRLAKPGAPILVMDLVRPTDPAGVDRLVTTYAGAAPAVLRRDFRCSLLAAYEVDEVRGQLAVAGLDYLSVQRVSDRHLAVFGRYRG